jgi:hypothetical protein
MKLNLSTFILALAIFAAALLAEEPSNLERRQDFGDPNGITPLGGRCTFRNDYFGSLSCVGGISNRNRDCGGTCASVNVISDSTYPLGQLLFWKLS